jgi:hypothetical protein
MPFAHWVSGLRCFFPFRCRVISKKTFVEEMWTKLCLVVWVLLLAAALPSAHSSLVAYYDFDGTIAGKRTKTK